MGNEARKLELITWLAELEDNDTLEFLRVIKDSRRSDSDWFDALSVGEREGIDRGLADVKAGRTVAHAAVVKRYGL